MSPNHAILLLAVLITSSQAQSPLICEDSIAGQAPFDSVDVPCLLRCGDGATRATGSILPGSHNLTNTPYCELDCVRKDATPAQSSAAPACDQQCRQRNSGTPEQLGWCMYWCVEGGDVAQSVVATSCVPSLEYVPVATSTLDDDFTVTVQGFTQPPQWASWYQTQTVIPRTSQKMFASTSMPATSMTTATATSSSLDSSSTPYSGSPALITSSMQLNGGTRGTAQAETRGTNSETGQETPSQVPSPSSGDGNGISHSRNVASLLWFPFCLSYMFAS